MYATRGDAAEAEKAYREVLKLNPQAAAAQVELSKLQLLAGRPDESLKLAQEAARTAPRSLDARLAVARGFIASKNLPAADREVRALLAEYPEVPAVHVQNGFLQAQKKDPTAARASFNRALSLDPESLEALAGLVSLDLSAKDTASAKARIDQRLNAGKPSESLLLLAARTYASANDLPGAERMLKQALEANPESLSAYGMLAQVYMAQRRLDEARREFDNVAERQARPIAALTMAGMILQAQGNNAEAQKRFERVVGIDPAASVAANNLAWLLAENGGDLNRALELAEAATRATPDVPEMMDTLGWVYYKKDLPKLAIPQFERAAQKAPENAMYHHHLGLAYLQAGSVAEARQALERALAAHPDPATTAQIRQALDRASR
jgi:tetratricopeptide (TPR) repeat protein